MKTTRDGVKINQFTLMMDSGAIDRLIVEQSDDGRFSITGEYHSISSQELKKLKLLVDTGGVRFFSKMDTVVEYVKKNFGTNTAIQLVLH